MPLVIKQRLLRPTSGDIRGPTSAPCSLPPLTVSFFARSTNSGILGSDKRAVLYGKRIIYHSLLSPTKIAVDSAIHLWPAAPKAAPASAFRVASLLASGRIVAWFLALIFDCGKSGKHKGLGIKAISDQNPHLHPFTIRSSSGVNVFASLVGTNKRDCADVWVITNKVHGISEKASRRMRSTLHVRMNALCAVNNVEHTWRQPSFAS